MYQLFQQISAVVSCPGLAIATGACLECQLSDIWGQAESTVHMLNWAIRSVKFLGVEFDQSEDEEVSVSDTTHL